MKHPGQLGDDGRNISIAEKSRRTMGATLFHALARIRKDEGVDPNRYPPVKSDIEYDTRRTMIGAEITARETADLILPAIRGAGSNADAKSGHRFIRIMLTLLVSLGVVTTTLAWMIYQESLYTNNRKEIRRSKAEYLGIALMTYSKLSVNRDGDDYVIDYKNSADDFLGNSIRIPHQIPPEELKRLYPE